MKPICLGPSDALIVTDALPGFMRGGGLAVEGGELVIRPIRKLAPTFKSVGGLVIALTDVHPRGHITLVSSYVGLEPCEITLGEVLRGEITLAKHALFTLEQLIEELGHLPGHKMCLWPDHCVFGSGEELLHPDLLDIDFDLIFPKGMNPLVDSYSGFRDNRWNTTHLAALLRSLGIKRVFVVGIAFDYCVGFTAEDTTYERFESFIIRDATASVAFPAADDWPGSVAVMEERLEGAGVKIITSEQISD